MTKHTLIAIFLLSTITAFPQTRKDIGGGCEDCDMMFAGMPSAIKSDVQLSPAGEKGEPLVITGTIYKPDGKTPAPGITLYMYHTDANGEYSPAPSQQDAKRHGHLRGCVKTDAQGHYRVSTIRPASYPQGRNPQHIHPIIYEADKGYYWIDEYLFDDDPFLTEKERSSQQGRGGKGIIKFKKDVNGVWTGTRDIVLGKNVPGYK
jgi:protocatechuate 3,4-dioxygenase beta subunit